MEHSRLTNCALWALCLLALVARGCGDGGVSESAGGDAGAVDAQESRIAESTDSEFRSGSGESDDGGDLVLGQEDGEDGVTGRAVDSVVEDAGQQTESAPEPQAEPSTLRSGEQQAADGAVDLTVPDASEPYHSEEVGSETRQEREELALDDRTQDQVVKLVVDSITLNDCVMRGEIRNYSEDQYARNVTVTVAALDGKESAQWHWPLTMKPGESAPFEMGIDWFPHTYDSNNPDGDMQNFLNINHWDQFGNTYIDIEADLSLMPDLRRAFDFNVDNTEIEILYQNANHKFLVFDERALELDVSKAWSRYGRDFTVITKPSFAFAFPGDMIKGHDFEPMVSTFELYKYADIFYIPSRIYPDIYKEGVDDYVSNVRVYQVYKYGSKVVDVRELIPHSVFEEEDGEGLLIDRQLNPIFDFVNYDISSGESIYVQLLDPWIFPAGFPVRNIEGEASTHQADFPPPPGWSKLWIGGVSHSEVSLTGDSTYTVENSASNSCYARGPLSVGDFTLRGQMAIQRVQTLGNLGGFIKIETDDKPTEVIYVEDETVTLQDQVIRGLVRNSSKKKFARDVIVTATHRDTGIQLGTWLWPLSVQPGESAPFEISYSESELTIGHIDFQVSATLSEQVDPTRSFLIARYTRGTVYGKNFENLYEYRAFDSPYPMNYELRLGQVFNHNALTARPGIRYTKGEFLKLYSGAISSENLDSFELFRFRDMYARLEPPDSHPELAKVATTQYIHDLRSYMAILDQDSKVVDVKEIPIFTPIYGQANTSKLYAEVDTIPAPNRWSPNAVRLLQIIPYEDEADMDEGYYSQVWIGGANP